MTHHSPAHRVAELAEREASEAARLREALETLARACTTQADDDMGREAVLVDPDSGDLSFGSVATFIGLVLEGVTAQHALKALDRRLRDAKAREAANHALREVDASVGSLAADVKDALTRVATALPPEAWVDPAEAACARCQHDPRSHRAGCVRCTCPGFVTLAQRLEQDLAKGIAQPFDVETVTGQQAPPCACGHNLGEHAAGGMGACIWAACACLAYRDPWATQAPDQSTYSAARERCVRDGCGHLRSVHGDMAQGAPCLYLGSVSEGRCTCAGYLKPKPTGDDDNGEHRRNGHLLALSECDWRCAYCSATFDAASDADQVPCKHAPTGVQDSPTQSIHPNPARPAPYPGTEALDAIRRTAERFAPQDPNQGNSTTDRP